MKDYSAKGKNYSRDNLDMVLLMQRGSHVVVRKGKRFEFEIPKGLEGHSRKKHKVHVGAVKVRLWPSFML